MIAENCKKCWDFVNNVCSGIQAEAADSEEKPCEDFTDCKDIEMKQEAEFGAENEYKNNRISF